MSSLKKEGQVKTPDFHHPEFLPNLNLDQISSRVKENLHRAAQVLNLEKVNPLKSTFFSNLEKIYERFSADLPREIKSFLYEKIETINNFYPLKTSQIILLCYSVSSETELRLYSAESASPESVQKLTEDSLQGLVVDESSNLAIVSCGLFENRIFVFQADSLKPVTTLMASGPVKLLELNLPRRSFVTLQRYADTVEWSLNDLGKFEVISSEKFDWLGSAKDSATVVLATSYGKISCFHGSDKTETKEAVKIKKITVSQYGEFLAVDSFKEVTVFNLNQKFSVVFKEKYEAIVKKLLFIKSNVLIVCLNNGNIFFVDFTVSRQPVRIKIDKVLDLKYTYIGELVALVGLKLFSVKVPELLPYYLLDGISLASFTPNNRCLYVNGKKLLEFDIETNVTRTILSFDDEIVKTHLIDEQKCFVSTKSKLFIINISNSEIIQEKLREDDKSIMYTVHDNSGNLYVGGNKNMIRVYNIESLEKTKEFGKHFSSITVILIYDNYQKLITREESCVRFFDLATFEETRVVTEKNTTINLCRAEKWLFVVKQYKIKIFDLHVNQFIHEFSHRSTLIYGVYFTLNNEYFILIGTDGCLRFWDRATLSMVFEIKVPESPNYLKMSQDEKYIMIRTDNKKRAIIVILNPLNSSEISFFGPSPNLYGLMMYFNDAKNMKPVTFQEEFEKTIIMPYKLTFPHIFAFLGQSALLKSSLYFNPIFSKCGSGVTVLDISLNFNNKNSVLTILKYFTKKITENPFIGESLTNENLIDLNLLGFESLLGFYDSLLYVNPVPNLPKTIKSSISLPYVTKTTAFISQPELFGIDSSDIEGGTSVEFVSSVIGLKISSGSQESIDFLISLLRCPYPDIFRSQFIQIIINSKWSRFFFLAVIEVALFVIYMSLLSAVSLTSESISLMIAFFVFGFILTVYEVLQVFGGVKVYLKDFWNFVDVTRSVLIILYLDCVINSRSYESTILLVLNLVSWVRGISYFRIFSKTRYMINLITEVCKDVFAFLIILAYSTIAFSFILMLMVDDRSKYGDYIIISYMITLGSINQPTYNTIQWVCFVFTTIINPIIMMNLLISIMGDTHDKVQENKEVADFKELTSIIFEIEVASVFRRLTSSESPPERFHICQEQKTKGMAVSWMGKVREIKNLINGMKLSQSKNFEVNSQILQENLKLKDQVGRIEKIVIGLKEKLTVQNNEAGDFEVSCNNGHKLIQSYHYDSLAKCSKCGNVNETGYSCETCSFFLCRTCLKLLLREKISGSEFTCFKDHKVTWLSDHNLYKNKQKVFRCVGCRKKLFKNSYNCQICSWDICRKCVEIIFTKASQAWSMHCSNNHPLVWRKKANLNYNCNICINSFRAVGSFRCSSCDFDVCIRCFDLMLK